MEYTYKPTHAQELKRLQALLSYNILDTPPQEEYDNLVKLVAIICNSPIAAISMLDDKRQWYKAKTGITGDEISKNETFCQYTLEQDGLLEIKDARNDARVKTLSHVEDENGIRFYAGVNLKSRSGHKIGTVCVADHHPRELSDKQKEALLLVADQTMILLEARKKNAILKGELQEIIITKEKEVSKQLLQKQTEYNQLLHAIKKSNAVVEFSCDGTIQTVNDNYLDIVGYSRRELVGKNREILIDEALRSKNAEFWALLQKGNSLSGKIKRKHKDGSVVWILANYSPITNEKNEIIKIIKIGQDITREIEAEKTLMRSKELAEKLNIQKDNFIANMSHEIRTPIHAILGFTGLLLEQEEEAVKKNYLESVKTAGDNLLFIINDILDLSKIEAGIIQLDKEPFDLLLTIDKVFSILHLKAHQKKISFKYVVHPKVKCNLVGDKNRLTQILINLLGNAIKFTSSGSVELFIEPKDLQQNITALKFKIVDTGIGIPEAKRESIFDRFSQADEDTSRNYGGTGLGLNISQQLIHRQGGSIWVESEEGKGSTFIFELPFQISSLKLQPIIEKSTPVLSVKKEGRILLCEDNELNQKLIKAILLEKGYEIDLAENGLKGIDLFQSNKYDLVLMDIQMPIMDGFATTKKIRQEIKSQVPIVALTANSLIVEKTKCLQLGMNDYLPKPFTKEDILTKVDQWINNLPADKSSEVRKNILVQDFLSFEVLKELSGGDKEFEKEMKILFLQQTDKVLEELKQASEFKDLHRIKTAAHKLKSSFGIFGINPGLLNALEDISQEDFVHSSVDQNLILLEERLKHIFRIINETLNPPINGNPTC